MSTILEALKKSELERKLNKLPTLTDMPAPAEQSDWPRWIILGLIALSIVLLVIVFSLWQGSNFFSRTQDIQAETILVDNESLLSASVEPPENHDIIVNVVSYSEQADQRFVMVNGKMYREGDFVKTGLKIVEIKPNSVILNQRGKRLELQP